MSDTAPNFCPHCGSRLKELTRFCPNCGKNLSGAPARARLGARQAAIVVVSGLFVCAFGWSVSQSLAGKAPSEHFKKHAESSAASQDPALEPLKKAAEAAPDDIEAWTKYAEGLAEKIREAEKPDPEIVFKTIDVLRHILDLDEKNAFALIAMADISFEQQAFSKAAEFYEKYLALQPDDGSARARYASTLSFMGRHDDAIAQLESVLKKDPKNFNARAYLAITHAQKGDFAKARRIGKEALEVAPSDEARSRFSEFLEKLSGEEKNAARTADGASSAASSADTSPAASEKVVAALKASPIAGPRLSRVEAEGDHIKFYMHSFPMSQMPPFAKEKFLAPLKEAAKGAKLRSIIFLDDESGEVLEEVAVQ